MSPELLTSEPDPARAKVEEYLAGMDAVRRGLFDTYFIEVNDRHEGIEITQENVDAEELRLRSVFAGLYPDLAPVGEEPHIVRGDN